MGAIETNENFLRIDTKTSDNQLLAILRTEKINQITDPYSLVTLLKDIDLAIEICSNQDEVDELKKYKHQIESNLPVAKLLYKINYLTMSLYSPVTAIGTPQTVNAQSETPV